MARPISEVPSRRDQPVLIHPVAPLHPAFRLGAVRGYHLDPQAVAGPAEMAFRLEDARQDFGVGRLPGEYEGVFLVAVQRVGYAVPFYPHLQDRHRPEYGFPLEKPGQPHLGVVVDHRDEATGAPAPLEPVVVAAAILNLPFH